MITPFQVYLITVMDAIRGMFIGLSICSGIFTFLTGIFYLVSLDPDLPQECKPILRTWFRRLLTTFCITLPLASFVPSTRQCCAIIAVPMVVNNEKIQEMDTSAADIVLAGLDYFKKKVEEKTKDEKCKDTL